MNFKELYFKWATDKKQYIKKSSISAYMLLAENHLLPDFGNNTEILEFDLQEFVLKKLQVGGLGQKTVKDILIVLKMILKWGHKHHEFIYKEFEIKFPTNHENKKTEVLSVSNYKKAVAYVINNFDFRNFGVLICLSTGLRIGEVCALRFEDIDLEAGVLKIRRTIQRIYVCDEGEKRRTELYIDTPKTKNSIREIPLSHDLVKIFKPLEKIVNPDFYVLTNNAKPTEPRTYRTYYYELMKIMEIPAIKFHGLRHSFATQCINAKVDVKTLSVMLGHSNVSTTFKLYVHPDAEQKKTAINQLFKSLK